MTKDGTLVSTVTVNDIFNTTVVRDKITKYNTINDFLRKNLCLDPQEEKLLIQCLKRDILIKNNTLRIVVMDICDFLIRTDKNIVDTLDIGTFLNLLEDGSKVNEELRKKIYNVSETIISNCLLDEDVTKLKIVGLYKIDTFIFENVCKHFPVKKLANSLYNLIPKLFENINMDFRNAMCDIALILAKDVKLSNEAFSINVNSLLCDITEKYVPIINELRIRSISIWQKLCIFVIRFLGNILHKEIVISNKILATLQKAFESSKMFDKLDAYDCWTELIENFSINEKYLCASKTVRLLLKPLKTTLARNYEIHVKRFDVWTRLLLKLENNSEECLEKYLKFCFTGLKTLNKSDVNESSSLPKELLPKATEILVNMFGHKCSTDSDYYCLNREEYHFKKQIINSDIFIKYYELIIDSIIECCKLLRCWTDLDVTGKVTKCLCTSLFAKINEMNQELKMEAYSCLITRLKLITKNNSDGSENSIFLPILQALLSNENLTNLYVDLNDYNDLNLIINFSSTWKLLTEILDFCSMSIHYKELYFILSNLLLINSNYDAAISLYLWNTLANSMLKWLNMHDNNDKTVIKEETMKVVMWLLKNYNIDSDKGKETLKQWEHFISYYINKYPNEINSLLENIINTGKTVPIFTISFIYLFSIMAMCIIKKKHLEEGGNILTILLEILLLPRIINSDNLLQVLEYLIELNLPDEEYLSKISLCIERFVHPHKEYGVLPILCKHMDECSILKSNLSSGLKLQLTEIDVNEINDKAVINFLNFLKASKREQTPKRIFQSPYRKNSEFSSPKTDSIFNFFAQKNAPTAAPTPHLNNLPKSNTETNPKKELFLRTATPKKGRKSIKDVSNIRTSPPIIRPEDDDSAKFVLIDQEYQFEPEKLSKHQRESLKRRRDDIPALYQDLSQSQNINDNSNSQMESSNSSQMLSKVMAKTDAELSEVCKKPKETQVTEKLNLVENDNNKSCSINEVVQNTCEKKPKTAKARKSLPVSRAANILKLAINKNEKKSNLVFPNLVQVQLETLKEIQTPKRKSGVTEDANKPASNVTVNEKQITSNENTENNDIAENVVTKKRGRKPKTTSFKKPKESRLSLKTNRLRKSLPATTLSDKQKIVKKLNQTVDANNKDHNVNTANILVDTPEMQHDNKNTSALEFESQSKKGTRKKRKNSEKSRTSNIDGDSSLSVRREMNKIKMDIVGAEEFLTPTKTRATRKSQFRNSFGKNRKKTERKEGNIAAKYDSLDNAETNKAHQVENLKNISDNNKVDDQPLKANDQPVIINYHPVESSIQVLETNNVPVRLNEQPVETNIQLGRQENVNSKTNDLPESIDIVENSQEPAKFISFKCSIIPETKEPIHDELMQKNNSAIQTEVKVTVNTTQDLKVSSFDHTYSCNFAKDTNQLLFSEMDTISLPQTLQTETEVKRNDISFSEMSTLPLSNKEVSFADLDTQSICEMPHILINDKCYVKLQSLTEEELKKQASPTYIEETPNNTTATSTLAGSPVLKDTPTRISQLLEETKDISPIRNEEVAPKMTAIKAKSVNSVISNDTPKRKKKRTVIPQSARSMMLNDLRQDIEKGITNAIKVKKTDISTANTSSPHSNRVQKIISICETKETAPSSESNQDINKSNQLLTFDKAVPNSDTLPRSSILKRKVPDSATEGFSPCTKKKKVNFSDPPTTSKKIYENDEDYGPSVDARLQEMFENIKDVTLEMDAVTVSDNPIYPRLIDLDVNIKHLLKYLVPERHIDKYQRELSSINISTIGALAQMNTVDVIKLGVNCSKLISITNAFKLYENEMKTICLMDGVRPLSDDNIPSSVDKCGKKIDEIMQIIKTNIHLNVEDIFQMINNMDSTALEESEKICNLISAVKVYVSTL